MYHSRQLQGHEAGGDGILTLEKKQQREKEVTLTL